MAKDSACTLAFFAFRMRNYALMHHKSAANAPSWNIYRIYAPRPFIGVMHFPSDPVPRTMQSYSP